MVPSSTCTVCSTVSCLIAAIQARDALLLALAVATLDLSGLNHILTSPLPKQSDVCCTMLTTVPERQLTPQVNL